MVEIVDQRRQQHGCRGVPKRVIGLAALGRGCLEQIRHQHLHLVVIGQIDEGVIAVTFLHVQQIQHPDLISGFLQQPSGIAQQLAFWVEADKGRTLRRQASLIQTGLGIRTGFACAAAADDDSIQIALVLAAVQPHADVLREHLVRLWRARPVLSVHGFRIAPFGRTVFLAAPVMTAGGKIDPDHYGIQDNENEDSFQAVLAPFNMKRRIHCRWKLPKDLG